METEEFYTEADWRCHTVVRVAATTTVPGLGTLPEGAIGKAVGIADYQVGQIAFSIPSATALFLTLSKRHYDDATVIAQDFSAAPSLQTLDDEAAFAYFENIMASVVFSYTALESFANEEIPGDYIHTVEKSKCKEIYDKVQIERNLTLQVKLGDILPVVCSIPSPKGTTAWQNFIALEILRHGIIHMKKADREHIGYSSQSVWSKLIQQPVPYAVATAKGIIDHFYGQCELKPHWYKNLPF